MCPTSSANCMEEAMKAAGACREASRKFPLCFQFVRVPSLFSLPLLVFPPSSRVGCGFRSILTLMSFHGLDIINGFVEHLIMHFSNCRVCLGLSHSQLVFNLLHFFLKLHLQVCIVLGQGIDVSPECATSRVGSLESDPSPSGVESLTPRIESLTFRSRVSQVF